MPTTDSTSTKHVAAAISSSTNTSVAAHSTVVSNGAPTTALLMKHKTGLEKKPFLGPASRKRAYEHEARNKFEAQLSVVSKAQYFFNYFCNLSGHQYDKYKWTV